MSKDLQTEIIRGQDLKGNEWDKIITLCNQAFEEDFETIYNTFANPTHLLGYHSGRLVSHALWVTRWLQVDDNPVLRTAYVEGVATDKEYRTRGYGTTIMNRLAQEIQDYELGALSPFSVAYYERLGWELWHGPLYIRTDTGLVRTPRDGDVMILLTSNTPDLDLYAPLSAEWREGEFW
jgi:aminoglycoside 2'-N-acetyltransferase I